jgi:hypothetical protein
MSFSMADPSGWLWALMDVVGVVALAGALVYSTIVWRRRRKDPIPRAEREETVRENYRSGELRPEARRQDDAPRKSVLRFL